MMQFVIKEEEANVILRHYLTERLRLSTRFIKKLTSEPGYLTINGNHVTVRYVIQSGDLLRIVLPPEKRSPSIKAEQIPLHIIYEDDWLLVINKAAGMPSIPSYQHPSGTVANGLLAYYDKKQLPYTIHIVTRLDKDTSGLMLIAKHQYSHSLLSQMQKRQDIKRYYRALVSGNLRKDKGSIRLPIRRKEGSIIEREVGAGGQEAITNYHVIKRYENFTYIKVQLETGRTHQIRVHFQALGHPLIGDSLYGGDMDILASQALHCAKLHFIHPVTKQALYFKAPLPESWVAIVGKE